MTRGRGKRFRHKGRGRGGRDPKRSRDANGGGNRKPWHFPPGEVFKNEKFEEYYKAQNIVPEEEFQLFVDTLNKSLPATFRINPLAPDADAIRERLLTDPVFSKEITLDDGTVVPPPRQLSWYEDAWQLGYGKPDLRKNESLKEFHQWMVLLTSNGSISRQEGVSMIPPLLLDVHPHHYVLDMCAAPGSKTAQLVEALHVGELRGEEPATGIVVANDSDSKRAYLLTHQCQRLRSTSIVVTCHDAQVFPNLNKGTNLTTNCTTATTPEEAAAMELLKNAPKGRYQSTPGCFDRVLADVPCSGDGTARKNGDVMYRWTPSAAIALHPLQIQIAMRGLALLKVGGLMAYSTCSLNPIENEAVVAEILRRSEGSVELVDVSGLLPNLKRSDGLFTWKVFDRDMDVHETHADSQKTNERGHVTRGAKKITPSMFPPELEVARDQYKLNRCMRILPHTQDTGGFFICVMKKTAPMPSGRPWYKPETKEETKEETTAEDTSATTPATPQEDGVDSEDEVDSAHVRPFYGRAGPSKTAPGAAPGTASAESEGEDKEQDAAKDEKGTDSGADTDTTATPATTTTVHRDGRGRAFSGRYELTVFSPVSEDLSRDVRDAFGLHPDFPMHMLHSRVDGGGSLTLMCGGVSADVIPHQRKNDGTGRVRLINAGVRVLQETKGSERRYYERNDNLGASDNESDAKDTKEQQSQRARQKSALFRLRIAQDGLSLLAPWMRRQIVQVSGHEMVSIMMYRGQFVTIDIFSPRLQAALRAIEMGTFALIVNPAIDGHEKATTVTGNGTEEDKVPDWAQTVDVDDDGTCAPKQIVPIAYENAIAPILRQHYVRDGDTLVYKPSQRIWPGNNPLARVFLSMWKGRQKFNLMITGPDSAAIIELLNTANYKAV